MKLLRLYLDTSVIGGYFDKEFAEVTRKLFVEIAVGRFVGVISDLVARELQRAPTNVQALVKKDAGIEWEFVEENAAAAELARNYLEAKIVGPSFMADCMHVAMATVCDADLLVSWNFRHIVRYDHVRKFNAVNLSMGYGLLEIRSPREVVPNED